ncbi:MAG TPA: hypothetical protein VKU35_04310 [Candidatus Limnocylindria bacterium]|nr:hypothetical protein [Candidatus Limnocylindria bacterium]
MLALAGLGSISGAGLASAVPAPPARQLTAAEVAASGASISTLVHARSGGSVLEVRLPGAASNPTVPAAERERRTALRLLATATDGSAAIADAVGDPEAGLTISHPDGSQSRTALAGVSGAAFSTDRDWLAVTDANGRLWRVEADSGDATKLADGPFGAAVDFERDGSLLLVAGSSAGAPYESRLVRFNPETRDSDPLYAAPGFVFSARRLADASVAAVVHPFGGGVAVVHIGAAETRLLAQLDPRAIDASVSADGTRIAYAVAGDGIYLATLGVSPARRLGPGDLPRIAPDGSSVLALQSGATVLLAPDGREIDRFASPATAWIPCGEEECQP